MKIFKTKTAINFPFGREIKNSVLYYTVEKVSVDANNLIPERGYYYFIDENNNPVTVSETKGTVILISNLEALEATLPVLISDTHLISNLNQRIEEMFYFQIDLDAQNGLSFGTTSDDWEVC
jgi:hypothetical protein